MENMELLLYPLLFAMGYLSCRMYESHKVSSASIVMIRTAQLSSLLMYTRAIEQYAYVKGFVKKTIQNREGTDREIKSFEIYVDNDIDYFKNQCIKSMNFAVPNSLRDDMSIDSWETGMFILNEQAQFVQHFFNERRAR